LTETNLTEFFKDIIFPPICSVCGKLDPEFLCSECRSGIISIDNDICEYCGRPFIEQNNTGSGICTFCKNGDYFFYKSRSFSYYKEPLIKIIQKYKYKKYYFLGKILANFLKQAYEKYFNNEIINYIDTVPAYTNPALRNNPDKNHMQLIAEQLSELVFIPFINNMIKIKDTLRQQKLDHYQRKTNLGGAFKVKNCLKIQGKNFLLIDDVWTTGATLNEISCMLKRSGADKIYLLTIARGI
jgi:competence protein ComFC